MSSIVANLVIARNVIIESAPAASQSGDPPTVEKRVVRRPFDALSVYKDTYASLVAPDSLLNTSSLTSQRYTTNFIIQSIVHSAQERSQVTHTFSEDRVFFFGPTIDTLQVDALLVENATFQWLQEWYRNYKDTMSGTATTTKKLDGQVTLECEDRTYSGFLTEMSTVRTAQERHGVQLRFTMLVAKVAFNRDLKNRGPKLGQSSAEPLAQATRKIQELRRVAVLNADKTSLRKLTEEEMLNAAFGGMLSTPSYESVPLHNAYPAEFVSDAAPSAITFSPVPVSAAPLPAIDPRDTTKIKEFISQVSSKVRQEKTATQQELDKEIKDSTSTSYVSSSTVGVGRRLLAFAVGAAGAAATGTLRGIATQRDGETLGQASLRGLEAATWGPVVDIKDTLQDMYQSDQLVAALT